MKDSNSSKRINRLPEYKFKLCIFGDGGVGKTTLTHRYLEGIFKESYKLTIGMDFFLKKFEYDGKKISLQIWDFAGETKFRFLLNGAVAGANGTILMFDLTRYFTFKNLNEWLDVFNKANDAHGQEVPIILVGSKLDLEKIRTVSKNEALKFAKENGFLDYIECSSKTGENVEKIFETITRIMLKRIPS
ncbi:MAG: Rab family GTPase [Promethearchaeota archaeon]